MQENDAQLLAACAVGKVAGEEVEEGLHLGVEGLSWGRSQRSMEEKESAKTTRTFLVSGSLTVFTSALSSLRMAFAATPVVEVLKSM